MQPDKAQTMPSIKDLVETNMSPRHWLQYYKNIWTRNLIARTIDVQTDMTMKAKNPEEKVVSEDGSKYIAVKERLESRKILMQDAIDLLASIEVLLAVPENEFVAKFFSKEALAVAPDMIPKKEEPKTGEAPAPEQASGEAKV